MTIIAYDGRYVAADKQATNHGTKFTCTKLFVDGPRVLAINGHLDHGMMMIAWIRAGCNPADYPKEPRETMAYVAVFERDRHVQVYEGQMVPWICEDKFYAAGCGRDSALAALHLGHSAVEAVEVTSKIEAHCGMGLDVIDLWSLKGEPGTA